CRAPCDGAELALAVEVGVVVLVAVDAAEPDGGAAEHVALRLGEAVGHRQHGDPPLADHVDTLVPSTATTGRTPRVGERRGRGAGRTRPAGPRAVVVPTAGEVSVAATAGLAAARVGKRGSGRHTRRRAGIATGVATVVVDRGIGSPGVAPREGSRRPGWCGSCASP